MSIHNQKGFANIALVILVVVLVGALGYLTLIKKSAPVEQSQTNNSQNNTNPSSNTNSPDNSVSSGPVGIVLPSGCNIVGTPQIENNSTRWQIDCGGKNNYNSRATLSPAFKAQGWTFCDSVLSTAHWWKNGIVTGIVEGQYETYFELIQSRGTNCQ